MSTSESLSFSVSVVEAVDALGGEHTASPLGQAVLAVRDEDTSRPNLTAGWLKTHGPRVRSMLVSFLTAKLTTSRRMDLIEDHVQTFLCRLVERDTLRDHLVEDKEPSPSVLRIWLMQSAATEMRGWGVDASLRVSRGAKTNRDRLVDAGKKVAAPVIHADPTREIVTVSDSGDVSTDYVASEPSPESALADRQMIEVCRRRIHEKLTAHHAAVFDALMGGAKRREVAEEQGLTTGQVTAMLARIREVVTDA
jgi:hypothetical protein